MFRALGQQSVVSRVGLSKLVSVPAFSRSFAGYQRRGRDVRSEQRWARGPRGHQHGNNKQSRDRKGAQQTDQYFDMAHRFQHRKPRRIDWNRLKRKLFPPRAREDIDETDTETGDGIDFANYDDIPVKIENPPETGGEPLTSFQSISETTGVDIPEWLDENFKLCGYNTPTPIQKHAVPLGLNKRDLMCSAQTGSGKTTAFLLPAVASLTAEGRHDEELVATPKMLVLAPTRELALQIEKETQKLCFRSELRSTSVYGGASVGPQMEALAQGVDIVIATPGRLTDLVDRGVVSLAKVQFLVLDEADRMLDMGFEPQIRQLIEDRGMMPNGDHNTPADYEGELRNTFMFSATFPDSIKKLARNFLRDFTNIAVGKVGGTVDSITQRVIRVNNRNEKRDLLIAAINEVEGKTLVFTETKAMADRLTYFLEDRGIRAGSIHGDLSQRQREQAIRDFRNGRSDVLVGTDVAARGLDIPAIAHVINFDLPREIDSYVHRVGRTGRAGRRGTSTSLFSPNMDQGLASELVELLTESKQEVPEFLENYRGRQKYGNNKRGGGGGGGRGYQGNNNRGRKPPQRGKYGRQYERTESYYGGNSDFHGGNKSSYDRDSRRPSGSRQRMGGGNGQYQRSSNNGDRAPQRGSNYGDRAPQRSSGRFQFEGDKDQGWSDHNKGGRDRDSNSSQNRRGGGRRNAPDFDPFI